MPKCIYCLQEKAARDFNIEHVIPQSFGTFENNFTLTEKVCSECNQYFGDELELFLGRDTFEGMLRYTYEVKAPNEFKFFNKGRLLFRLNEEGPWKRAILQLKYSEEQNKVVADPVNQVGFQKKGDGEWDFFEIKDIRSEDDLEKQGFIVKGKKILKFLFESPDKLEEMKQQLVKRGFKVDTEGEEIPFGFDNKVVDVKIHGTVDKTIYRGIGKIAFNYLAYIVEEEGWKDFVFNNSFDQTRNFVRYGESGGGGLVFPQMEAILFTEKRFGFKETNNHMITVEWSASKQALTSQVTLFNEIVYRVILCRKFNGIYREIARGHHFDLESRKISKLTVLPKTFYIF